MARSRRMGGNVMRTDDHRAWMAAPVTGNGPGPGELPLAEACIPERQQAILITRFAPKRDIHMFPYRKTTTKLIAGLVAFLYGRGKRR